jgi:hypothetical protein
VRVVVWLAWARLRHRPARWLLVALGVAAATVVPILAESTATVVAKQALRHGVEALAPGDRNLAAIRQGLRETPERIEELDRAARHGLIELSAGPVRVQMLTRAISDGVGGSYYFAAADGLADRIRLTEGRAPTSCTPTRCEVVAIGTGAARPPDAVGLVVVGRAVRTDPLLFAGSFDPGDGAPMLIADGVAAAAQLEYLSAFQRSYAWVAPVDLDRVDALGVDGYLAQSARASIELYAARISLTAPDDILRAEAARAQRSTRRFALLGGSAAALLLGFAVIGAIGLRRDNAATAELLRRRGASRAHTAVLAGVGAGVAVAAGAVLGVGAGALLAGWQAHAAGLSTVESGLQAVRAGWLTTAIEALAAAVVVAFTLAIPGAGRGRAAWRAVDLAIAVGLFVAALAIARGAVNAEALGGGTDPLLFALPIVAVVCGGLLAGRAWPALTAAVARAVPPRMLAPRLGLVGAVRSPLRPVATAAFLAAATGTVAFAGMYQATLRHGAADQATFAVPLDATVRTGQSQRPPLDVASVRDYAAAGAIVHPVVRSPATVRINAAQSLTPELIGVDPHALPLIRSWDEVVGASDPDEAGGLLAGPAPDSAGLPVPAGARTIVFAATGNLADVDVSGWLRLPDGRDVGVPLTTDGLRLVAALPAGLPSARLFALTMTEDSFAATRRQHRTGEGELDAAALTGRLELGVLEPGVLELNPPGPSPPGPSPPGPSPPSLPEASPPGTRGEPAWAGWGSDGARVTVDADRIRIDYQLTGAEVVIRAGHGAPAVPVPVFADARTAAAATNGMLQLSVGSGSTVPARVVGVLPRFPTTGSAFVVADVRALADALDARDPGTGSVSELWLAASGPDLAAALAAPPFDLLRVDLRQTHEDRLTSDPLARGAARLLTGSALLAFVVALLALVLLVVAERRDESAQLYAWESDGVAPATLRLSLFVRAVAVVAVGVPAGVLIGLALSRITAAVVRVTAVGTEPVPPLSLAVSPIWIVTAVGVGIAAGLAVCGAVAAAALRERMPRRPEEGLA